MKKKSLTDKGGEVRELTKDDLKKFRPPGEALPPHLAGLLPRRKPGQRGPQKKPTKDQITLRLDHDVLEHFKATGPGWQSRINSVLRDATKRTG